MTVCFLFQRFAIILLPLGFLFVFAFHLTVLEPRPQADLPTKGNQDDGTLKSIPDLYKFTMNYLLLASALTSLDSESSGPGSSPGLGHCVVFLGKTLNTHSASLTHVY